jgi:hypothetical protein
MVGCWCPLQRSNTACTPTCTPVAPLYSPTHPPTHLPTHLRRHDCMFQIGGLWTYQLVEKLRDAVVVSTGASPLLVTGSSGWVLASTAQHRPFVLCASLCAWVVRLCAHPCGPQVWSGHRSALPSAAPPPWGCGARRHCDAPRLGWDGGVPNAPAPLVRPVVTVLCCAVLCCAVLCCAVLCCAVLCCAVLCCAVLGTGLPTSFPRNAHPLTHNHPHTNPHTNPHTHPHTHTPTHTPHNHTPTPHPLP